MDNRDPGSTGQSSGAQEPDSRRGALIGLVVILLLVVGGLVLTHVLHNMSRLQDCVMSGRSNCAPVRSTQ
jgi:hypothetical protein